MTSAQPIAPTQSQSSGTNDTSTRMSPLVADILGEFRANGDPQGHEFKLRYPKSQSGNTRFARAVAELFPTCTRGSKSSRADADVCAAMGDAEHVRAWRARYAHLPHDTEAIIERWLRRLLDADTMRGLQAAACIVFASRSTIKLAPDIVPFFDDAATQSDNMLMACWRKTEKCGKPRVVPLLFRAPTAAQYKDMAAALPRAKEWTDYEQIWELFDELDVPIYSRKGNLPRLILCALMDRAESDGARLAPLMRELPRGRADLFNLVLGHISRSYLLWTYMGMLIKDAPSGAQGSKEATGDNKENRAESYATRQVLAEKDRLLAEKDAEIEALRAQLAQLQTSGHSPASSAYSLSPLSSPLKPLSPL